MGTSALPDIYVRMNPGASAYHITNMFHFCTLKKAASILLIFSPTITGFWLKFNPTITACLIPYMKEEDHSRNLLISGDSVHSY